MIVSIKYEDESGEEHLIITSERCNCLLFMAKNIAKILKLTNISKHLANYENEVEKVFLVIEDERGKYSEYFLTEIGLYTLLGSSRKENARHLMKWANLLIRENISKNIKKNNIVDEIDKDCKIKDLKILTNTSAKFNVFIFDTSIKEKGCKKNLIIQTTKLNSEEIEKTLFDLFPNGRIEFFRTIKSETFDIVKYKEYIKFMLSSYCRDDFIIKDRYEINIDFAKLILITPIILNRFIDADDIKLLNQKIEDNSDDELATFDKINYNFADIFSYL